MKRTFSLFFFTFLILSLSASAQYRRIVTFAGAGGTGGYGGDGFAATGALLNGPEGLALDKLGNLFIVDYYNSRVRKVKKDGTMVTFAGSGFGGYSGDGSDATSANIDPIGVAADPRGNVYIADYGYSVIRKVNTVGIISTYAGGNGWGYTGDGGLAIHAKLMLPFGLCTDKRSTLYVADGANHVIRMIDTFGHISTIAGNGTPGYSGDGFAATDAQLDSPYAVAMDKWGDLYIADHNNNVIRMVDPSGMIYTIAGTGTVGYSGDNGPAVSATLHYPTSVAVDTQGNVFIADSYNNVIREVDTLGKITTFAGNGWPGFGGDLGNPLGANLYHPYGLAIDTFGSVYISDANNQRVRKVYVTSLGVSNFETNSGIKAFPDPFENELNVSGLQRGDKVTLCDMTGRQVNFWTASSENDQAYSLGELSSGIYLLQVCDELGNKKATIKVVK